MADAWDVKPMLIAILPATLGNYEVKGSGKISTRASETAEVAQPQGLGRRGSA